MATRVYTLSSGTPDVTPVDWEFPNQINPVSVPGTLTRNTGSAMTSKADPTDSSGTAHFRAMGRTILGPLAAATISGTVAGQMRGMENNANASATLAMAIKLIQPSGTDRGVLLAPSASDATTAGNELVVNTLTNTPFKTVTEGTSHTLTSQNATAGDYLVIEWGFRCVTGTPRTITLSYGNDSATDLTAGNTTETTALNPWWEFSATFALLPVTRNLTATVRGTSTTPAALGYGTPPVGLPTTGLTLHCDASDTGKIFTTFQASGVHTGTPVDGSEVPVWDDEGDGIADVALVGATGFSPHWSSTTPILPLPCLDFSTDEYFTSVNQTNTVGVLASSLMTTTTFTILVAFAAEAVITNNATIYLNDALFSEGTPNLGMHLKNESGVYKLYGYHNSGGVPHLVPAAGFTIQLNTPYVMMFRHEAGTIYASLDGGAESSTVSGTTTGLAGRLWTGIAYPNGLYFNGRLGEFAVYNTALTGGTLAQALTYFTTKWLPPTAVTRTLTATLTGASTTSEALGALTGVRVLTSHVTGESTTPASGLTTVRLLTSAVAGQSVTPAALGLPDAVVTLPTTGLTLHADASDTGRIFTTLQPSGVHTGTPVDGSEVQVWDDEGDGITNVALVGAVNFSPHWRSATPILPLPCLDFSTDQYFTSVNQDNTVGVLASDLMTPTAFTILVAFAIEGVTTNDATIYLNEAIFAEGTQQWGMHLKNESGVYKLYGYNNDGSVDVVPASGFTLQLNTAYVFMFRHEAGSIYASLNGGTESSTASGTTTGLAGRFWTGIAYPNGFYYNGRIGEFAVYNTALTGATLTQALAYFTTKWLPPPPVTRTLIATLTGTSTTPAAVGQAAAPRLLTARLLGGSTTSAIQGAIQRALTATTRGSSTTVAVSMQGLALRLSTPVGANHGYVFPTTTLLILSGGQHGLGTDRLHVAVYDAQIPRQRLTSGRVAIDPTTYDVHVTFAQPQAGLLVLNAGHPAPGSTGNYTASFEPTTLLSLPNSLHQLSTATLLLAVYDTSTPRVEVVPGGMTVDASGNVEVGFLQAQSGTVVLCGYTGTGGTTNAAVALPGTSPVTILEATHGLATDGILVSVYDTSTPPQLVQPGRVTVHPTTHTVTLEFLQPQPGTVVLNGSYRLPFPPLQARLQGTIQTPASGLVTARLVTGQASTTSQTTQASIVLTALRTLTATLHSRSTTAESLVTTVRPLTAALVGTSLSSAASSTVQHLLLAVLPGRSTTAVADIVLTALRTLTATLGSTSGTSASAVTTARLLTASLPATSTTASADVVLTALRTLTARLTSTSATSLVAPTMQRALQGQVGGSSATSSSVVTTQRVLSTSLTTTTRTSMGHAVLTALRSLSASLRSTTTTADAGLATQRLVTVQALATSTTSSSAVVTVRVLTGSALHGAGATSSSLILTLREFSSRVAGATATPPAVGAAQRVLLARLSSGSATPPSTAQQGRLLSAQLSGTGSTPLAAGITLRPLTSRLSTTSVTPSALGAVQRLLRPRLAAQSSTRVPTIIVSGLRSLTARLQSSTSTPAVSITQQRVWGSALQGATSTASILVTTQRPLTGRLAAQSQTPPALLVNTITWQAVLRDASTTPASLPVMHRTLLALLPGQSVTAAVAVQSQRLLQSAMQSTSLTPVSTGVLIRRISSVLAGQSVTTSITYALARHLTAILRGATASGPLVVTTERLLVSHLQALSENVPLLLIPNSGEMLCYAALQGTSSTAGGTVLFLPPSRIGQVGPRERVGRVPARARTALVS